MLKRGQISIFVIIALILVFSTILFFLLRPVIFRSKFELPDLNGYMKQCIELKFGPIIDNVSAKGGYLEPQLAVIYHQIPRAYLCYTTEPYAACEQLVPMLKDHIESELKSVMQDKAIVQQCLEEFKEQISRGGYVLTYSRPEIDVKIVPENVLVSINTSVVISREDEITKFNHFDIQFNHPLYDYIIIAKKIISESIINHYFDPASYMIMHQSVIIDESSVSDGSRVYVIRKRNSNKEFGFAIRNYVFPGGVV